MIAKKLLPKRFIDWNMKWNCPYGKKYNLSICGNQISFDLSNIKYNKFANNNRFILPFIGIFGLQDNSSTRIYEYPWAYYATAIEENMSVVEIGGGLSGFQFVLSKEGMNITNIDPGDKSHNWEYNESHFDILNRVFGTNVRLISKRIEEVYIPDCSIDRVYCISVLEHLSNKEILHIFKSVIRILKPGGYFIITVDLFLDLFPFSEKLRNKYGANLSIKEIIEMSQMKLILGKKDELNGFNEFNTKNIIAKLPMYLVGKTWPVLSQCFVLKKIINGYGI